MKLTNLFVLLLVVFILTYDPTSGTMEKYIAPLVGSTAGFPPSAKQAIAEQAPENRHYEQVQFGA